METLKIVPDKLLIAEKMVLLSVTEELVEPRENSQAHRTTLDFGGLLNTPLILVEDLTNGCGGQLWPAGMVLGKYLLRQHAEDMIGKRMYVHVSFAVGRNITDRVVDSSSAQGAA
jgi:Lysine methyltransferase